MPNGFSWEEQTWGYAGPYTRTYAEFLEGYAGPIKVTHPNGQSKTIIVEPGEYAKEWGMPPSDQDVEAAVIAALSDLGALPALVDWKKYLPWGIAGVLVLALIISLARK